MDTVIHPQHIDKADLRGATEIWLVRSEVPPPQDDPAHGQCLWRGGPVVSHDMLSEGTHEQNLRRLWVLAPGLDDPAAMTELERRVRARLAEQGMHGEFYPATR